VLRVSFVLSKMRRRNYVSRIAIPYQVLCGFKDDV
jgi:hypothetical protein